jgi:hypothetical protein
LRGGSPLGCSVKPPSFFPFTSWLGIAEGYIW